MNFPIIIFIIFIILILVIAIIVSSTPKTPKPLIYEKNKSKNKLIKNNLYILRKMFGRAGLDKNFAKRKS